MNNDGRYTYKQRRARDSLQEASGLTPRDIRCPECGKKILVAFDDCKGHVSIYCNHCHDFRIINFKFFRLGSKK